MKFFLRYFFIKTIKNKYIDHLLLVKDPKLSFGTLQLRVFFTNLLNIIKIKNTIGLSLVSKIIFFALIRSKNCEISSNFTE